MDSEGRDPYLLAVRTYTPTADAFAGFSLALNAQLEKIIGNILNNIMLFFFCLRQKKLKNEPYRYTLFTGISDKTCQSH